MASAHLGTASGESGKLTQAESRRYSRHLILPEVGIDGQLKLKNSSVLLVGAGGLGSPAALYLAAAGVGLLGLLDDDTVDASNLQRQILHSTAWLGRPKVDSAVSRVGDLNPDVRVVGLNQRLTAKNAMEVLGGFDVVLDGTDNFATRYLINDAAFLLGKPVVHASVLRFEGRASVFGLPSGPCYRCLYPQPPEPGSVPSCAQAGVLGVVPGLLGTIQAAEALKILLGIGSTLSGRLLMIDVLRMQFREFAVRRDPQCELCGAARGALLEDYDDWCARGAGQSQVRQLEPRELQAMLARGHSVELIDVREPWEWGIAHLVGARLIPLGTFDEMIASLPRDREVVIYCHHGARSQSAAERLAQAGHQSVSNLAGGIARWRRDVEPSMPGY